MKKTKLSWDNFILIIIYILLALLSAGSMLPILQVITISVSPPEVINSYGLHLIPLQFNFDGYREIMKNSLIWTAYQNTILRTLLGTAITIALTFLGAYPLSKKSLPHRPYWTGVIVLTMFFSGGMIPSYLLIKNIGLMDTMWALVLPGAVSTFMLLVARNFLVAIPESLEEAAKIDGAHELYIFFKIIIPLSMPIIVTVGLYSAVYHWNAWFDSMIYIQDQNKQVLQLLLRKIIIDGMDANNSLDASAVFVNSDSIKMATLVITILPIIIVYPFLQKYFIKGTMIGSVKG